MTGAWSILASPLGELLLTARDGALTGLYFDPHRGAPARVRADGTPRDDDHPVLRSARDQLAAYLAGDLRVFDLPLAPAGTVFQRRVWVALAEIPYGTTESYGHLAARLGLPAGASRAVGLANGANPISIVLPCHRVVGADGSLTGYGGGLDRKRHLLDLEADLLF